jgi:hypothetical protein
MSAAQQKIDRLQREIEKQKCAAPVSHAARHGTGAPALP